MLEVNRAPLSVEEVLTTPHYLSEGVLGQLALAFLLSPVHTDPGLVAPLVALYALREDDRRAMLLYVVMTAAACPVDLQWLSTAIKAHDVLPSVRPSRVDPATLQQKVVGVVETALREEVQRLATARPTRVSVAKAPPPPPSEPSPTIKEKAARTEAELLAQTFNTSKAAAAPGAPAAAGASAVPPAASRRVAASPSESWDEV